MKAYRRRSAEEKGYAPDRVAALLWSAVTVGLWLLWLVSLGVNADRSRLGAWLLGNWSPIGYYGVDSLVGVFFCVGMYSGRRWAIVGKAYHGSRSVLSFVFYGQSSPVVLVELIAIGYCLLRLLGVLGERPVAAGKSPAFLPDRLVGLGFAALNIVSTLRLLAKGAPAGSWLPGFWAWFALSLSELLWFDLAVVRSRGWTPLLGAAFCSMGVMGLYYKPEERVQWFAAWLGLFYFAARLGSYGPRPEGALGLASE